MDSRVTRRNASSSYATSSVHQARLYWPLPFLLWTAARFGPRSTSLALTGVSALSIWGALAQRGPFASQAPLDMTDVDLSAIADVVLDELQARDTGRRLVRDIQPGLRVRGDRRLLSRACLSLARSSAPAAAAIENGGRHAPGRYGRFHRQPSRVVSSCRGTIRWADRPGGR